MISLLAYIGIGIAALLLYKLDKLTASGMWSACVVGWLTITGVGVGGLVVIAVFFGSSIVWGRLDSSKVDVDVVAKHGARDAWQVLANGGVAGLCSLLAWLFPGYAAFAFAGFIGSLAGATADTWASELGKYSREKPIHLLTLKRVSPGVSGAVSALGMAAAFAGSFLVAATAILIWWRYTPLSHIWLLVYSAIGFLANLADSLFGAAIQVLYRCPVCGLETERLNHCGEKTEKIKGFRVATNDTINFICTFTGAALGVLAVALIGR